MAKHDAMVWLPGVAVMVQKPRPQRLRVDPRTQHVFSLPVELIPALRAVLEEAEAISLEIGTLNRETYQRSGLTPPGEQRTPFDEQPEVRLLPVPAQR